MRNNSTKTPSYFSVFGSKMRLVVITWFIASAVAYVGIGVGGYQP